MPQFLDFELQIGPGQGREYPVTVTQSPAGRVAASMRFPFDEAVLAQTLAGLSEEIVLSRSSSGATGGATTRGVDLEPDTAAARTSTVTTFGTQLYEALFTGEVARAFRESKYAARQARVGLRVRLRIEAAELASLPWEFLYDPASGDFVCLAADTPVVRYLQVDRPMTALKVQPPIRILAMVSSPRGHAALDVALEKRRIEEATAGLRGAGLLEIEWMPAATVDALQKALRTGVYHVFHYVGHGGFDAALGKGVMIFSTDDGGAHVVDAAMLARILSREDSLRLVVLNSCLGSKGSPTDLFSSTAATLVRGGVPAVVGMQYEISDVAAIRFARTLYDSIGDGFPVDAAVAEARVALSTTEGSVEWGTPVLHMLSPDGVLFEIDGMRTSEARTTGAYRIEPRPLSATTTGEVPPAVTVTPPAPVAPVAASIPSTPTPTAKSPVSMPAVPPPAAPARGGGLGRTVGIAVGSAVATLALVVWLSTRGGGSDATTDSATDSTAVTDSSAMASDSAAATDSTAGWIVGFEGVQGGDHTWIRVDSTCRWVEMIVQGTDTTFADQYVQVSSTDTELELFNRESRVTLVMPTSGGWVSIDSGGGRALVNSGIRVTRMIGALPSVVPECEQGPSP